MTGVGTCFWEADMFKIGGTLRYTTSCGEHYIIKNIMPFHICPFCKKTIWFTEGAQNTEQANQPDSQ